MSDSLPPGVGGVCSADIAVPEHEHELRFYSRVLSTGQKPLWREDLMNNLGVPIIGLGERIPDYAHLPLQWMPHIQVADVASSAEHALGLGGKKLMHGKDDDGSSQWAVLLDPNGAAFGIIPVVPADELPTTAHAGRIGRLDLTVSDASGTRDFYRQVVGWSSQDSPMADRDGPYTDYSLLAHDDHPAAGICHARGVNLGLPPVWIISLPVGNLAESLAHVRDGGGKVIKATRGSDGAFTRAVIQDPVGAYIALESI